MWINLIGLFLVFLSNIFAAFDISFDYSQYMGGWDVLSYGIHVLGSPLFYLIMTSLVSIYTFKLVFAIINWIWQQLPLS